MATRNQASKTAQDAEHKLRQTQAEYTAARPAPERGVKPMMSNSRMYVCRRCQANFKTGDGVVFVEARNEATILGTPCRWQSVYRVRLDGDRVIDGRRYYDRAPLLATFDPATPRLPALAAFEPAPTVEPLACLERGVTSEELLALLARSWREQVWHALAALFRDDATWHAPGVEGSLRRDAITAFRARFARLLAGVPPRLVASAGDDSLVLTEWRADVPTPSGGSYALGMVERFDLVAGRVLAARTYLDAASLARAVAAPSPDPARS